MQSIGFFTMLLMFIFGLNVIAAGIPQPTSTPTPTTAPNATQVMKRSETSITLHITNSCTMDKSFQIFYAPSGTVMIPWTAPTEIPSGQVGQLLSDFYWTGMRLSGHGEWTDQFQEQALFEWSYSTAGDADGTFWDLSMMLTDNNAHDPGVGIGAWPRTLNCPGKICWPWAAPLDQCWTNPDQDQIGSPANLGCYQGVVDFDVTYCP